MHLNQRVSFDWIRSRVGNCIHVYSESLSGALFGPTLHTPYLYESKVSKMVGGEVGAVVGLYRVAITETYGWSYWYQVASDSTKVWAFWVEPLARLCFFFLIFPFLIISAEYEQRARADPCFPAALYNAVGCGCGILQVSVSSSWAGLCTPSPVAVQSVSVWVVRYYYCWASNQ